MMEKTLKGSSAFFFDCSAIFCLAFALASMFFLCPFFPPVFPFLPLHHTQITRRMQRLCFPFSTQLLWLRCSNDAVPDFCSSPMSKASAAASPQGRNTGSTFAFIPLLGTYIKMNSSTQSILFSHP